MSRPPGRSLAHLVDGGVVFHGDRFSEVDDRAAHRPRHAVERLDPEGDELGQLIDVPRLRPRDDVVGPGQARRLRDARQAPERRGHDSRLAGFGLDQDGRGDHVTLTQPSGTIQPLVELPLNK